MAFVSAANPTDVIDIINAKIMEHVFTDRDYAEALEKNPETNPEIQPTKPRR
jgi:hypothetical protein